MRAEVVSVAVTRSGSGTNHGAVEVHLAREALAGMARYWWALVVAGVALVVYSFVILSFTVTTVLAVAVFVGAGLVFSGITQIASSRVVADHRVLLLVLGLVDLALGIAALVWPDITFVVLVRLVGWVLLVRGLFDVVDAFLARHAGVEGWWLPLVLGAASIVVAVWAVRYPGRSVVLLVLWAGLAVMVRGVGTIVLGFALRGVRSATQTA